ncbi:MAG: hypothetical protein AB7N73_10010 [Gemmatimonadales bacterium]
MKHYLSYWTVDQVQEALERGELPHAASAQYGRLTTGNRVWICGRAHDTPELFVIGYIDVWHRVDEETAQRLLDDQYDDYLPWEADWHILPRASEVCATQAVSLVPIYTRLKFDSSANSRLKLINGHPNAQQLQTMRKLTPDGAAVLQGHWAKSTGSG